MRSSPTPRRRGRGSGRAPSSRAPSPPPPPAPAMIAVREQQGLEAQRALAEQPPTEQPPPKAQKRAETLDRASVLEPIRVAYERDLGSFFRSQRGALNDTFKASDDDIARIVEKAIRILTAKRFRDLLRRISEGPIGSAITFGATEAATKLGIGVSFAIPASEAALARVTNHLELLGAGIENTTVADVRRVLTDSLRAGVSNAETRKALDTLFDGYA